MTVKLLTALMIVMTSIASVLAGTAAPIDSAADLANARVPSLCDHPAGRLRNGVLPGIPEGQGVVALRRDQVAIGRLLPGGRGHAAAVIACNRGGVAWPDNVVFYNRRGRIIGHVELFDVTRGGREHVRRIWIRNRRVHIEVANIAQEGDAACCGTASAKLVYRWDRQSRSMELVQRRIFTERNAMNGLIAAFNDDDRTRASRFATDEVVELLWNWRGYELQVGHCVAPAVLVEGARQCDAGPTDGAPLAFFFGMRQTAWNRWIAADYAFFHLT
ncbi:MAG: hypothetical protein ACE367_03230 [Acidimicrobiales bacterium]